MANLPRRATRYQQMLRSLRFNLTLLRRAARDVNFRRHALSEVWQLTREYLPARLITRRRDYVFCRYLNTRNPDLKEGRWLPPTGLAYRLSAYGLLFDEAGHLLMVSDKSLNFGWNLPGGGINKHETLAGGLKREFEEETGLKVKVGPVVANSDDFCIMPTGRAVHAVLHFFLVQVEGGRLLPEGNGFDTSKVAYINLDTVLPREVNNYPMMRSLSARGQALLRLEELAEFYY